MAWGQSGGSNAKRRRSPAGLFSDMSLLRNLTQNEGRISGVFVACALAFYLFWGQGRYEKFYVFILPALAIPILQTIDILSRDLGNIACKFRRLRGRTLHGWIALSSVVLTLLGGLAQGFAAVSSIKAQPNEYSVLHSKRGDIERQEKTGLIAELRLEFTNLFIGVGDDTVHLLESAYLNRKATRYDDPAQDVQTAHQSLGFKKDAEFYEPEDHVALEFEFMERICEWIVQALHAKDIGNATAYLSLQKEFLRDHVLRWVPKLCERLKPKAESDFYSSLAYLTSAFVEMDYQMPDHLTAILRKGLS
jgi:TorA maturation chaperone TorD